VSQPVERCHAAVARRVKDFREDRLAYLDEATKAKPFELVADQCRRAASTTAGTYPVCATHAANHESGFISPAAPFIGKGHWEWVVDED